MKKVLVFLLSVLMLFALAACGGEGQIDDLTSDSTTTTTAGASNDIDLDFKKAMDSYEEFVDKYVSFMEKYNANPTDTGLLAEYSSYMSDYADFVEDFENWENEDLNADELAYYAEVQSRTSKKLLEVIQ